jgi:hypothetical protein
MVVARTVRRSEGEGPAHLSGQVWLGVETVEIANPSLIGRLAGVAEAEATMKVREPGHCAGEVVRADQRRAASEAQLQLDVAGGKIRAITDNRTASLPARRSRHAPIEGAPSHAGSGVGHVQAGLRQFERAFGVLWARMCWSERCG